jgi:uncharacterized protein involved in exopolysaccharide biosynthesis
MTARPTDPGIHALAVADVDGGFDGDRARDADRDGDPELGLVDLLLVLAENARLLVIGPSVAVLVALAFVSLLPQRWESVTLLRGASPTLVTVVTSPAVLLPVARAEGLAAGQSADEAVEKLRGRIKASFNPKDLVLTLIVVDDSPVAAQVLGRLIFEQLKIASAPAGSEKARFETQMADISRREEQIDGPIQALSARMRDMPPAVASELSRSFGQLISTAHQLNADRMVIAKQLAGVDESHLLQAPSLPDRPQGRKRAVIALVTALGVFCLLLLGASFRLALCAAASDPASAPKLRRAREAWRHAIGRDWAAAGRNRPSVPRAHPR